MKIFGLTKIRNEEAIIKDTLDNWGQICDEIYVVDDASTDRTVEICQVHPKVKKVQVVSEWDTDRERAEWVNRQLALTMAQEKATPEDWFCYFDADEQLYDFTDWDLFKKYELISCQLFDIYITPKDVDKSYQQRKWMGPEFRVIPFFFKNSPYLRYWMPDQRVITYDPAVKSVRHGFVKHYSKGISIEQYEATCRYYIDYWPKYSEKWKNRVGKAVKTDMLSDFGNKLIKWKDRDTGFLLQN
jgi:glycosyltransferase involved in cell wall biosynthesis